MDRALRIGVMGPGECTRGEARTARAVGRRIALGGGILICGGGSGVMEAAAQGAREAGGVVVGILPSDDERKANPFVDIPVITGLGNARNAINALTSHALIAIAGGPGTLSEIALALKVGTPVVGLNTWRFSIGQTRSGRFDIHKSPTPRDAVNRAFRLARAQVDRLATDNNDSTGPVE
jgi:hypothetical protein